jgi:GR25 family glycosyltransferase involved in LPS biosynthesis
LGWDPAPVITQTIVPVISSVQAELAGPFHFFDGTYCINLDRQRDRWEAVQARFRKLGIEHKVRRFSAAETPLNHHIGCALSHRRIVAEAKQQGLETVLVFEDDVRFSPAAADELKRSLRELEGRSWQLLYLGVYGSQNSSPIAGCEHLRVANYVTCTHAIAYHCSVYDMILDAVPATAIDVALWLHTELAIDQYFNRLPATRLLTWPVVATQTSIIQDETRVFDG